MNDEEFIKKTNLNLERRQKLKRKKRGSTTRKPSDPRRSTEAKRFLNSKKKRLGGQEEKLFFEFMKIYPPNEMKIDTALTVWNFLHFLKEKGYHIIDGETVFCFPFKYMVKLKNLK